MLFRSRSLGVHGLRKQCEQQEGEEQERRTADGRCVAHSVSNEEGDNAAQITAQRRRLASSGALSVGENRSWQVSDARRQALAGALLTAMRGGAEAPQRRRAELLIDPLSSTVVRNPVHTTVIAPRKLAGLAITLLSFAFAPMPL